AMGEGNLDEARRLLEASQGTFEELGNQWWMARMLGLLGDISRRQGNIEPAQASLERAFATARHVDARHSQAWVLVLLARLGRCGPVRADLYGPQHEDTLGRRARRPSHRHLRLRRRLRPGDLEPGPVT